MIDNTETLAESLASVLPTMGTFFVVTGFVLYVCSKYGFIHHALLSLCGICTIGMFMFFTGLAPISPDSHRIIAKMVEDIPVLNDSVYQAVNDGLYISMNDYEHLSQHWENCRPLNNGADRIVCPVDEK